MKPLIVSFEDKEVVIFGGGKVGRRKASFFEDEADVQVISKNFVEGFSDLDVELVQRDVEKEEVSDLIKNASLVIAATDNEELNSVISKAANKMNKLVNRVSGGSGDVILPSSIENKYLLAISTFGKAPAFCKFMRKRFEEELGYEYELMVRLQNEFREKLKEEISSQEERKSILWKIINDEEVWECLQNNFYEKAVNRCEEIIGEEHG